MSSAVLKLSKDGELRTEHGNRFRAAGPATTNARPPNFGPQDAICKMVPDVAE